MSEQLLLPAFENEILKINIEELHFSKEIPPQLLMGRKFQVILASIKEVGIIEPPVVTVKNGKYHLDRNHIFIVGCFVEHIQKRIDTFIRIGKKFVLFFNLIQNRTISGKGRGFSWCSSFIE